jgi:hypothetical protein
MSLSAAKQTHLFTANYVRAEESASERENKPQIWTRPVLRRFPRGSL